MNFYQITEYRANKSLSAPGDIDDAGDRVIWLKARSQMDAVDWLTRHYPEIKTGHVAKLDYAVDFPDGLDVDCITGEVKTPGGSNYGAD